MRLTRGLLLALLSACGSGSTTTDSGLTSDLGLRPGSDGSVVEGTPDLTTHAASDGGTSADLAGPVTGNTILRIHYPAGAHSLTVRGAAGGLSWTQGQTLTVGVDDTYTFSTSTLSGTAEWKPLLDDKTWALGPNYHVSAGQTLDVYPHFMTTTGQVKKLIAGFTSAKLPGSTRNIWAYLPPTYLENARARMPVVYMHDGQNLFDPSLAFGGNAWMADQTMDYAASSGTCSSTAKTCMNDGDCGGSTCDTFAEAVIIGVENTSDRIAEYTPVPDPQDGGGKGDLYLAMLVDELKPKIDSMLRTRPEREHTAMVGSSLGGLITAWAGVSRADTFGLCGVMSPSTWWDNTWIIGQVKTSGAGGKSKPVRVYLDSGDAGPSNDDVTNTNQLATTYLSIGFVDGQSFHHVVAPGDQHSEVYWARRLPGALRFLLGPR